MWYNKVKCADEYLENVLANWHAFRRANGGLCEAIEEVLNELHNLRECKCKVQAREKEWRYLEALTKLTEDIDANVSIPQDDKDAIAVNINNLFAMLWKYSA